MPLKPFNDSAWHRVLCWPGLSAESKLGWLFLFSLAGDKPGTIRVREADVGANQGAADPKRMGQRVLKHLADRGLIVIVERDGPEYKLRVLDPATVPPQPPNGGGEKSAA